ncbi:unnamed protein product [marine sediment metagenome]|uniref:Uncharacterized protein n=1 Tax=marine sediment metagenome TaxID=412755 RepID=X1HEA8_9ZZZZ
MKKKKKPKLYYYSIERYELTELFSFLKDCNKRYKKPDIKIASSMTTIWIISNKDLYAPLQEDFKYKYRELKNRPYPERRYQCRWIDYKIKLKTLRKILKRR